MNVEPGAPQTVLPDPVGAIAQPAQGFHLILRMIEGDTMIKKSAVERVVVIEAQGTIARQRPAETIQPAAASAFQPCDRHAGLRILTASRGERRGNRCLGQEIRRRIAEAHRFHRDRLAVFRDSQGGHPLRGEIAALEIVHAAGALAEGLPSLSVGREIEFITCVGIDLFKINVQLHRAGKARCVKPIGARSGVLDGGRQPLHRTSVLGGTGGFRGFRGLAGLGRRGLGKGQSWSVGQRERLFAAPHAFQHATGSVETSGQAIGHQTNLARGGFHLGRAGLGFVISRTRDPG